MRDTAGTDAARQDGSAFQTDVPTRLAQLPWGRFHTLVSVALFVAWILDGTSASRRSFP